MIPLMRGIHRCGVGFDLQHAHLERDESAQQGALIVLEAGHHYFGAGSGHRSRPLERGDRLAHSWMAAQEYEIVPAEAATEQTIERFHVGG